MKILLLFFLPFIANAQIAYTGTIVNKQTKAGISYATVGLMKENTGVNTDELGKFNLTAKKYANDTLIISSVGFETLKVPVNRFTMYMEFEMEEKQTLLKEILIKSKYSQSATLNDFSNCGMNSYTSTGAITQVAQHFRSPAPDALLSEIHICKQGDNSLFRIRIYNIDTISGAPSTDLADTIIDIKSGKRHVTLNLEQFHIMIPGNDFFVAVEWLYIPFNRSNTKATINGTKINYFQYSPFLFFKERKNNISNAENSLESWELNYNGKWKRIHDDWKMLIAATVKY